MNEAYSLYVRSEQGVPNFD